MCELKKNSFPKVSSSSKELSFPLDVNIVYSSNNRLSIEIDSVEQTHTIDEWISQQPLIFAQLKHQQEFEMDPHLTRVLFERMRRIPNHEKMFLGLDLNIDFPGYPSPIPASIPYSRYPVKFYNWWLENPQSIRMSFKEKLKLLNKVNMLDKKALIPKHKALMNR